MIVPEGKRIPKGYRPVWCNKDGLVCYRIGVHWIMSLWFRLRVWWSRDLEIKKNQAYRQGYLNGQKDSEFDKMSLYAQGFKEGRDDQ